MFRLHSSLLKRLLAKHYYLSLDEICKITPSDFKSQYSDALTDHIESRKRKERESERKYLLMFANCSEKQETI